MTKDDHKNFQDVRAGLRAFHKLRRHNIKGMKIAKRIKHKELKDIFAKSTRRAQKNLEISLFGKWQKLLIDNANIPASLKDEIKNSDKRLVEKNERKERIHRLRRLLKQVRKSLLKSEKKHHHKHDDKKHGDKKHDDHKHDDKKHDDHKHDDKKLDDHKHDDKLDDKRHDDKKHDDKKHDEHKKKGESEEEGIHEAPPSRDDIPKEAQHKDEHKKDDHKDDKHKDDHHKDDHKDDHHKDDKHKDDQHKDDHKDDHHKDDKHKDDKHKDDKHKKDKDHHKKHKKHRLTNVCRDLRELGKAHVKAYKDQLKHHDSKKADKPRGYSPPKPVESADSPMKVAGKVTTIPPPTATKVKARK